MKAAVAKAADDRMLEDLGRATLQIVHDLKNQLNGIKLYATYLRKRAERENRSAEEQEILAKLIAGLDRAARETTALVRLSRPIELRRRRADLRRILLEAVPSAVVGDSEAQLFGEFDSEALLEAFRSLTEHLVNHVSSRDRNQIVIIISREKTSNSSQAIIEWSGALFDGDKRCFGDYGSVHAALAARIIEGHCGRVEFQSQLIRAWLPLTD